jgi:hypothetical protein
MQLGQALQTPLHLVEPSTELVRGTEYGHGGDSRPVLQEHTGWALCDVPKAIPHVHLVHRTINCRCAYPAVTNRLHGEGIKILKF